MNEKGANIDLLFRNGLKDFEVLPPAEVWDNIYPAIKRKSHPLILFRIAAVAAVLLTISLLAYMWTRGVSDIPSGPVTAFNVPVSSPLISQPVDNPKILPKILPVKNNGQVINSQNDLNGSDITASIPQETLIAQSAEQITYFRDTKNLNINNFNEITGKAILTHLKTSQDNLSKIKYQDLIYFPDNSTPKLENRWSVAAMASPTYYSKFNTGSDKQLMESEQPLISYSGGVSFSYKINKRFSVQSGLYYSSLGQKIDGVDSYSGFEHYVYTKGVSNFEVLTTNGSIYTNNPDVFLASQGTDKVRTAYTSDVFDPNKVNLQSVSNSLNQNFSYLELPVILKYKIVDKTVGINLIGGLSYDLLVSNSVYATVDGTKYSIGETGLNPHVLSSSLGMGMEYNFSGNLSFNLEPTFRYYLNPLSATTSSFIHSYSFGIFSGVSFKF